MKKDDYIGEVIKKEDPKAYEEYLIGLKINKLKEHILNNTLENVVLSEEDLMLVDKLKTFICVLPEEYYKCIGCWCNENDYPNCVECTFYKFCVKKVRPFPNDCRDGDCQRMRKNVVQFLEGKNVKGLL